MTAGAGARIGVLGASGKMGRAIVRLARDAGMEIACAVAATEVGRDVGELAGVGHLGVLVTDDMEALAQSRVSVCIDFSSPAGTRAVAAIAGEAGFGLVSGTTGLDDTTSVALESASRTVPVLWEPNMSVGVHVLGTLLRRAVELLGPAFDVEIVETHHRLKADAPSGTAMRLAEIAQRARGDSARLVHGRYGRPGARPAGEIGVHAVRGGDVVGDHVVSLLGTGERIELSHRASSRDLFAHGAVRAAAWLAGKPAGRYQLVDMLGAVARPSMGVRTSRPPSY